MRRFATGARPNVLRALVDDDVHDGPVGRIVTKRQLIGGLGFGTVAQTYDHIRPSYPQSAIDWVFVGLGDSLDVIDVGAGTGKLTAQLLAPGRRVHAIEPDPNMLRVLTKKLPTVTGHLGTGEALPLAASSADVVTVAQAFHWMDEERSMTEFARILRPGGRVALLWNDRDSQRAEWNEILTRKLQSLGENTTAHRSAGLVPEQPLGFDPVEGLTVPWVQDITPEGLLDLVRSRSYVIALSASRREAFLDEVRELLETHPQLAGRASFPLPYLTSVFRYTRR